MAGVDFRDLLKRLLLSCAGGALIALLILFAYHPFAICSLAIFLAALSAFGIWEYGKLAGLRKGCIALLMTCGISIVLGFFLSAFSSPTSLPLALFFLSLLAIFLYHFNRKKPLRIAESFFGLCYIAAPIGLFPKILYCSSGAVGRYWLLYLLIATKITDIGAYFGGRLFRGKRLAPRISPDKRLSGAIVGLLCAIATSALFALLRYPGFSLTFPQSLWLGALLGALGQAGDLGESLFKREAGVKDSNHLPGLGGVLDMLDSLLFTTPLIYLFLHTS